MRPLPQPNNTGKVLAGVVIVGAVAGILFLAWPASAATAANPDPFKDLPRPPDLDPATTKDPGDLEGEASYCKVAAVVQPTSSGQRVRGVNQPLEEWLAYCAYWQTYPGENHAEDLHDCPDHFAAVALGVFRIDGRPGDYISTDNTCGHGPEEATR